MKNSTIASFIGGAFVGAVLALLFAPAKGSETRTKIKETLEDGYETVKREIKKHTSKEETDADEWEETDSNESEA